MSEKENIESEEKKKADRDNERETHAEQVYEMKGIAGHFYLTENGEFKWIPAAKVCVNKGSAKRFLEILKKIPADRRAVWAQRLDVDEAKITCPIIRKEVDLCKEFDEFCAAYTKPQENKPREKQKEGGESA